MRRSIALVLAGAALVLPRAATAAQGLEGVPSFSHIAVIMLENENAASTWGASSPAKFLNSLVPQGVFLPNYYATGHVSLDNYVALVSGEPGQPDSDSDCLSASFWRCVQWQRVSPTQDRNLADQLEEKNVSWKGYMDSMPSPCFHAPYDMTSTSTDPYQGDSQAAPAKDYADRHNPFNYFPDIVENDARCQAHVRPYTDLADDLANDTLPQFSFISPDTCHDGHDATCSDGSKGGLAGFDAWLKANAPPLISYLNAHDGLLLITADEDGFSTTPPPGCCSGGPTGFLPGYGGRVGLLALGPALKAGKIIPASESYDHMSFLRTIEDSFGISEHLNNAGQAQGMASLFN